MHFVAAEFKKKSPADSFESKMQLVFFCKVEKVLCVFECEVCIMQHGKRRVQSGK